MYHVDKSLTCTPDSQHTSIVLGVGVLRGGLEKNVPLEVNTDSFCYVFLCVLAYISK